MPKPEDAQTDSEANRYEQLASKVGNLQKIVVLVIIACLVISVCVNLYVVPENLVIKGTFKNYQQEMHKNLELYQFTQHLVMDLQALGQSDAAVRTLLTKYSHANSGLRPPPETPAPPTE